MRKIKNKKGFTLVEMLACVVTLLLIGMIVSTGMNLATMSLRETTFESDSQMLESTLNMYIGDILRHATDVKEDATGVHFTNDAYYIDEGSFNIDLSKSEISGAGYLTCTSTLDDSEYGIMVATEGAYAGCLYIKDFTLNYDENKKVFSGSYVIVSSATTTTKTCEFSFRSIADVSITE